METTLSSGNLQSFLRLLDEKKMTPERFTSILNNGILADVLDANADIGNRDTVRVALKLGAAMSDIFRIFVDYRQSLKQMIANGYYHKEDDRITAATVTIKGKGIVAFDARYFCFFSSISSEEAILEIGKRGKDEQWLPAKIEHLLALGEKFPEEQRKFLIVSLGSIIKYIGNSYTPCLGEDSSLRSLILCSWFNNWSPSCRFLAVRKVSE